MTTSEEYEEEARRIEAAIRNLVQHGDTAREAIMLANSAFAELTILCDTELFNGAEGNDLGSELASAALSMRHVRRIIEARAALLDAAPDTEAIGAVIDRYHEGEIQPTDALGEIYRMFPGGQVAAS